jgi:phosphoglycolate phosphatase
MPDTFFDAAIFDFDGTLAELVLDFTAMKTLVADVAASHLAVVPPANGLPALEYAAALTAAIAGNDPGAARRFTADAAQAIMAMEVEAAATARLFPETRAALARLAGRGVKIGIITRNCRRAVLTVFPDVADFAGVLLARDDTPRVKPDPAHLLAALAALGAAPERSLMVGDHPMDVAVGKAAGTRTAGVASGQISLNELARHQPDYLASDVRGLIDHFIE